MFLDTREHVAEFNSPGQALAIGDDELRQRLRALHSEVREIVRAGLPPHLVIDLDIQGRRAVARHGYQFDIVGRSAIDRDGI